MREPTLEDEMSEINVLDRTRRAPHLQYDNRRVTKTVLGHWTGDLAEHRRLTIRADARSAQAA